MTAAEVSILIARLEGALEHANYSGTCLISPDLVRAVIAALREKVDRHET